MSSPIKNACTPSNIYGGLQQTMFLGCSITGFSATGGLNEQISEITVQLVVDPCANPNGKVYYDTTLSPQTWTEADPGFFGFDYDIIGAPAYFRLGDFEFTGLIQSYEEVNSISGNPIFIVKLVDPRELLQNTQLIIGDYSGGVGGVPNVINLYGFLESLGGSCPQKYQLAPGTYSNGSGGVDGAAFGSPAGAYGGSNWNENGLQWNQMLNALQVLLCADPPTTNIWSPYGRLLFRGPSDIGTYGMGLLLSDDPIMTGMCGYLVDLSELPTAPTYWRFSGSNVSLMECITQICQDAGYDYYIELDPVGGAGYVYKIIKVRTINRNISPVLNALDTFVDTPAREGLIVNLNRGRELRNEITSSFVIGGNKQTFYQAFQNDSPGGPNGSPPTEANYMIIPYFGINEDSGNVLVPTQDGDGYWQVDIPCKDLVDSLAFYGVTGMPDHIVVNEKEMLAALINFDIWFSYASMANTALYAGSGVKLQGAHLGLQQIFDLLAKVKDNPNVMDMRGLDHINLGPKVFFKHDDPSIDIVQICYNWIRKLVDEYYGKKFQVRVPWTCARVDSESNEVLTSEEPSDGGWTDVATVLGLANPGILTDFFRLDDNRLGAFCKIGTADEKDISLLSPDDFVVDSDNNNLYVSCSIEQDYVYLNKSTVFSPRAVLTLSNQIKQIQPNFPVNFRGIAVLLQLLQGFALDDAQRVILENLKNAGTIYETVFWPNRPYMPDAFGFGIKSNVLTYGPWGDYGVPGGTIVHHNAGLVPWEYGGMDVMNLAGQSIADEGITTVQVNTEGSVEVAGYPNLPLGAELLAADSGGPFFGGGANLFENRVIVTTSVSGYSTISTNIFAWVGSFGPNITGIDVQVGIQGFTTTYHMRVWTPKFGRFARGNAERLQRIGRNRMNFQRNMRALFFREIKHKTLKGIAQQVKQHFNKEVNGMQNGGVGSPQSMFVGMLGRWNNGQYRRPFVESYTGVEVMREAAYKYDKKAIMSFDGLFRPISTVPTSDLPGYATATSNCQSSFNRGIQPPVGSGLDKYNQPIKINHLDPFANPGSTVVNRSNTTSIGHDIEILARDTGVHDGGLLLPIAGSVSGSQDSQDYFDTYRGFALRGPLLIHGWGYDLDGFPVPNKADVGATGGQFVTDATVTNKFADNWLRDSRSWPVAPLDVRYDRQRAVWTIPQYRDVLATLTDDLTANGSVLATITPDYDLADGTGGTISNPQIMVKDKVGQCLPSGTKVIATFNPAKCEYWIMKSPGPFISKWNCEDSQDLTLQKIPVNYLIASTGIGIMPIPNETGFDPCSLKIYSTLTFNTITATGTGCGNDSSGGALGGSIDDSTKKSYESIVFGKGFKFTQGRNSCEAIIDYTGSPGIKVTGDASCPGSGSATPTYPGFSATSLSFGGGLYYEQQGCTGKIYAGFKIANENNCSIVARESNGLKQTLVAQRGIILDGSIDCEAQIGLDFDVNGIRTTKIDFSNCFQVTDDGDCEVSVDLNRGDGSGLFQVPFVNDIFDFSVTGNVLTLTLNRGLLQFTACGLYYGWTTGDVVTVDITGTTCPTGTGGG